jgi:glycosyltransferase involved in cell wall biosynthesis
MRILTCCNIYPPHFIGGAELVAHYQSKQMVAVGHEVQVFTGDTEAIGRRHDLRTEIYDGLTVHRVHLTGKDYPPDYVNFSHPRVEAHFSNILTDFQPDVVHCHNIIGLSVKIIHLAREFGARVVLTLHDHWGFCFKNTIMKKVGVACVDFERCDECMSVIDDGCGRNIPMRMRQDFMKMAMNAVDAFVSPSQYLANTYLKAGFAPERMHVIWNGIDTEKFATIAREPLKDKLRFSFFGYFGRHKGIHTLLEALALLKDPESARINLIGAGEEQKAYEQQLLDNGCTARVKFWGKLDNNDVYRAYAETDVLVLPSIWGENQPVSITEAMACAIPVIGSNMGGIPELVEDGLSGYIFEAGNAADLAEKMDRMIADRNSVKAMGINGFRKIRNHSLVRQVDKLLSLYREERKDQICETDSVPIIACIGQRVDSNCARAMTRLGQYLADTQPYMLMSEWLTEKQVERARLAWAVDCAISITAFSSVANKGLPSLIPENNVGLLQICKQYNCGLYYNDEEDAAACIAYILTHLDDSIAMSFNAKGAFVQC